MLAFRLRPPAVGIAARPPWPKGLPGLAVSHFIHQISGEKHHVDDIGHAVKKIDHPPESTGISFYRQRPSPWRRLLEQEPGRQKSADDGHGQILDKIPRAQKAQLGVAKRELVLHGRLKQDIGHPAESVGRHRAQKNHDDDDPSTAACFPCGAPYGKSCK